MRCRPRAISKEGPLGSGGQQWAAVLAHRQEWPGAVGSRRLRAVQLFLLVSGGTLQCRPHEARTLEPLSGRGFLESQDGQNSSSPKLMTGSAECARLWRGGGQHIFPEQEQQVGACWPAWYCPVYQPAPPHHRPCSQGLGSSWVGTAHRQPSPGHCCPASPFRGAVLGGFGCCLDAHIGRHQAHPTNERITPWLVAEPHLLVSGSRVLGQLADSCADCSLSEPRHKAGHKGHERLFQYVGQLSPTKQVGQTGEEDV